MVANILQHRLADLRAATATKDLVAGKPRLLDGMGGQDMAVDLCNGHRIIFTANHPENPQSETGNVDWAKVSRIKILRIEGDHV